mgnify:CR=1 FL=1
MSKPLFKSPECLVSKWPEVFEDLYINTLPIDYIDLVKFEFINGGQWVIDLNENLNNDIKMLEKLIVEAFNEFEDEISKLEFSIDIIKLKKDITNQSKRFF